MFPLFRYNGSRKNPQRRGQVEKGDVVRKVHVVRLLGELHRRGWSRPPAERYAGQEVRSQFTLITTYLP